MKQTQLNCWFFPDLLPWERTAVVPIIARLSERHLVNQIEVGNSLRGHLKRDQSEDIHWILSSNWRRALDFLGVRGGTKTIWASVFGLPAEGGSLFTLLWKRLRPSLPPVRLLTHSPLNFRFYRELVGLGRKQVAFLHFPFSSQFMHELDRIGRKHADPLVVGTFAHFTSESNLNYFVNVAHYVRRHRPDTRFSILGSGVLYPHLARMIQQMDLEECVSVVETVTHESISELDLLLHVPLRNDHFIPILVGAAAGLPVLSSEVTGIEEFIQDGKNGFVVPCNETKPMGELAIRLLDHGFLRQSMAKELRAHLASRFSEEALASDYDSLFFGSAASNPMFQAA